MTQAYSVSPSVLKIDSCRVCGNRALTPVLSLGELYVSDFLDRSETGALKAPLELVICDGEAGGCGLLQLLHNVSASAMYFNYWYKSGMNPVMREALADISEKASRAVALNKNDLVLDIGCNDGTLLRSYTTKSLRLVGFEPGRNLIPEAQTGTSKIFNDFFNAPAFVKTFGSEKAKIITSIAMFYDLQDPNAFVSDVKQCLAQDGVWIIQMSYLPLMLERLAFDNICHEHLEYYSLFSLENLLKRHKLKVLGVELNEVNGGSFRVYVSHEQCDTIALLANDIEVLESSRKQEKNLGLGTRKIYEEFAGRIHDNKKRLTDFIRKEVSSGKRVYAYGASTKGNTLLQYFGLDHRWIAFAAERNPDKWGKQTVGTGIPIISEEQARLEKPDYFLVLPWHFLENFKQREAEFLRSGGKFIVPLPTFQIVER